MNKRQESSQKTIAPESENKIKLSLQGEIDGKEIAGKIEINYVDKNKTIKSLEKKKTIGWTFLFSRFVFPLIILFALFIGGLFFKFYFYWLLVLIPVFYGWLFYSMNSNSPTADLNYLRKLTDMITLFSALITATFVIFKIFNLNSNIVDLLINLKKENPAEIIKSYYNQLQIATLFVLMEIFATFASIKFFFSVKDFNDTRKRTNE